MVRRSTACTSSTSCPPTIRRATVAEMARVLKPGGVAIVTDSIQLGDRERLDANLGRFGDFNEPFYRTYITEDFGEPLQTRRQQHCPSIKREVGCSIILALFCLDICED